MPCHHDLHHALLVGLLASMAVGCTSNSSPAPGGTPSDPQAEAEPGPPEAGDGAQAPGAKAAPGDEPEPSKATEDSDAPLPGRDRAGTSSASGPLHVVATREGWLELLPSRPFPAVAIDGEPAPIVSGRPVRHATGGSGLRSPRQEPMAYFQTVAFMGDMNRPRQAWLTTVEHFDRQASDYRSYERTAEGWRPLALAKGLLRAHYPAFVERDGAVLALELWSVDPSKDLYEPGDDGPEATAHLEAVDRALRRAKPAWVQLAGEPIQAPSIPEGTRPFTAVATDDGTLIALARSTKGSLDRVELLVWPKGSSEAERVPLPGSSTGLQEPKLHASGAWALVSEGSRSGDADATYLAVGRGTSWEAIEVSTPERDDDLTKDLVGAVRRPDGELWIAFGNHWNPEGELQPLWRKPEDGAWEAVALPPPDPAWFSSEHGWVYAAVDTGGGSWVEVSRAPVAPTTTRWRPTGLVWSNDAVWATLELGEAFASDDMVVPVPRSVLLTTKPGPASVEALPSSWKARLERHNAAQSGARPGKQPCEHFSLVLGPPPKEPGTLADSVLGLELDGVALDQAYVGRLDGAEVLVVSVHTLDPEGVSGLADEVTEAIERPVTLDCRTPPLMQMVRGS